MKKLLRAVVFIAAFLVACGFCQIRVRAGELNAEPYEEYMNRLELNEISGVIDKTGTLPDGLSFTDTVILALKGELGSTLSEMISGILASLFSEVTSFSGLLREMLVIALLGAIFRALSENLRSNAVSELGFYATYVIIVAILLDTFTECLDVTRNFVGELCRLIEAATPLMSSLLLVSGNPTSAVVFNPLAMFAAGAAELLISNVAAPLLVFSAVLSIVNNLTEKETLSRLAELIKKGVSIGLKVMAGIFVAVLTFQRVSAPIADGAIAKTAKFAVSAVPVVGSALSGAVDSVAYWAGAVKSGVMLAVILSIIFLCLPAVIKAAAFVIIYKFTAALIQPVCDKRVVNAVSAAGDLSAVALGACVLAAMVFVFMTMIVISI